MKQGFHNIETFLNAHHLGAFVVYVVYLSGRLIGMSSTFIALQPVFASMGRLLEMFDTVPEFSVNKKSERTITPRKVTGEYRIQAGFIWL